MSAGDTTRNEKVATFIIYNLCLSEMHFNEELPKSKHYETGINCDGVCAIIISPHFLK